MTAGAAAGQLTGTASVREKRAEAEKLLSQARKAIKQGDFAEAEKLIAQAEKAGAKYDPLTERFVDTPQKLRKLLAEQRSKAPPSTALASAAVPADPLRGAQPSVNPQAVDHAVQQLADNGKSRAMMHLNDARAALAHGDKLAALAAWQKAAGIPAPYAPGEISPQSVADELVRAGIDPSRLVPAAANNPSAPYMLRPGDISPANELVRGGPPLAGPPGALPPGAAAPANVSPYNLPPEAHPLAQSQESGVRGQESGVRGQESGPLKAEVMHELNVSGVQFVVSRLLKISITEVRVVVGDP
jgi:hypothetical protein